MIVLPLLIMILEGKPIHEKQLFIGSYSNPPPPVHALILLQKRASISTVQSINIIGRKTSIVNGNLANALMFTLPKSTTNTSISAAETATIISSSVHVSNSSLHSKTNKSHKSNTSNNISNNRPRSLIIPAPPTLPAPKPPSPQSSATSASPPSRHHSSSNNGRKETSSNLKSPSSTLRVHGEQRSLTRSNTVDRKRALVELAGGGGDGGDKIIPNRKTSIAERRKSKQLPGPLIIDDCKYKWRREMSSHSYSNNSLFLFKLVITCIHHLHVSDQKM